MRWARQLAAVEFNYGFMRNYRISAHSPVVNESNYTQLAWVKAVVRTLLYGPFDVEEPFGGCPDLPVLTSSPPHSDLQTTGWHQPLPQHRAPCARDFITKTTAFRQIYSGGCYKWMKCVNMLSPFSWSYVQNQLYWLTFVIKYLKPETN